MMMRMAAMAVMITVLAACSKHKVAYDWEHAHYASPAQVAISTSQSAPAASMPTANVYFFDEDRR